MKHTQFFSDFLDEQVNLNQSRLNRLNTSVKAISEFLSQNLDSCTKVERQGSYALRTIIKPVKDVQEYDADVLLYMKYDRTWKPKDYISELYKRLQNNEVYAEKARRKTRCVVLDYADDFHLDIVPCVSSGKREQYICNYETNEFEQTDGTGYRDWFNGKNSVTHGNLKRVTRLLKYLRDHKGNFTAKSILLTTLIGNSVRVEDYEDNGDCFRAIPDSLKTVSNRINDFLARNPFMPTIYNPVLSTEDFTRHWDQRKYDNFRNLFNTYNDKINKAFNTEEHDESIEKWRDVFGENFGRKKGLKSDDGSSISIAVTPIKPYAK